MRAARRIIFALVGTVALACAAAPSWAVTYNIENIVLTGDQWAGASTPFAFINESPIPVLDSAGNVIFSGDVTNGDFVTAAQYGANSNVLTEQADISLDPYSAAPGAIDLVANDLSQLSLSTGQPGNATAIAIVGNPAPGVADDYASIATPAVTNASGDVAFFGAYGAGNTNAVWFNSSGGVALRADTSSLIADGGAVTYISSIHMNDAGTIAVLGIGASDHDGIWTLPAASSPQLVAQYGDSVAGGTIAHLNSPDINDAGHVAFVAATSAGDSRLYFYNGSMNEVLRTGTPIVSIGSLSFSALSDPVINHNDRIAFSGTLVQGGVVDSTNDECIAITGPAATGLSLVARKGESLASIGLPNVSFEAPADTFGTALSINASGDVLFEAYLQDSVSLRDNDSGIFVWDAADDSLHLIARVGDSLPGDPGHSIVYLTLNSNSGGEDGYTNSFNDADQVTFSAEFDDGTWGVYLASPVSAPEPASLGLLAAGALCLTLRRRRR